uniref:Uncharacterized protein n=1 Tax=Timema cristinae TaxID=61476 RepID=A0A7R9CBG9_TIMCR|nr:unnamed protein product [Timema cristinae]
MDKLGIHISSIERSYLLDESEDHDYDLDLDMYRPVQSLSNDHGVSFFPISAPHSGMDHHVLQVLHHGSTAVHWDAEGGSRTALAYVRLERSCATLTWGRPAWSGLRTGAGNSPDYCLSANPEETVAPALSAKLAGGGEAAWVTLEEGYLDLAAVKEIVVGSRDREKDPDLATACRRYGLDKFPTAECCLALVYGSNLSDNRVLFLLCPPNLCRYSTTTRCTIQPRVWFVVRMWYMGLCWVVRGLKRQLQLTDRRMIWLKEQYLQLFFDECPCGPMTADAIRVFGGRDWALTGNVGGMSPPDGGSLKRGPSAKFKKKKSISNIQELGLRPHEGPEVSISPGGGSSYVRRPAGSSGPSPSAGPSTITTPRSRSISSEMEVRPIVAHSPQGSNDNLDRLTGSPYRKYTASSLCLVCAHREKAKSTAGLESVWQAKHFRAGSITHETQLDFVDFVALFRSFRTLLFVQGTVFVVKPRVN